MITSFHMDGQTTDTLGRGLYSRTQTFQKELSVIWRSEVILPTFIDSTRNWVVVHETFMDSLKTIIKYYQRVSFRRNNPSWECYPPSIP
jgi:hypothetical protein